MPKKKDKRKPVNKRPVVVRPNLTGVGQAMSSMSLDQQLTQGQNQQIEALKRKLASELDRIQSGPPLVPPPPAQHTLVSVVHKEDPDDPSNSWIKLTCENCAFLLFAHAGEVSQKLEEASPFCRMPFAKREKAMALVEEWQQAVDKAYDEMVADIPRLIVDVDDNSADASTSA